MWTPQDLFFLATPLSPACLSFEAISQVMAILAGSLSVSPLQTQHTRQIVPACLFWRVRSSPLCPAIVFQSSLVGCLTSALNEVRSIHFLASPLLPVPSFLLLRLVFPRATSAVRAPPSFFVLSTSRLGISPACRPLLSPAVRQALFDSRPSSHSAFAVI